jgi:hypothetical protein
LLHIIKANEGLSTHPQPMCYVELVDKSRSNVEVTMYVVCNGPFPLGDVIGCNCRHFYHQPWCVTTWFKSASSYKKEQCTSVHPERLNIFGFASLTIELKEKVASLDCEMVQRMAIVQRKDIMQSIHPTISNASCLIHSFFKIYILV